MDFKLLNKLQSSDTATLILNRRVNDTLTYYIVSQTTHYAVICSGICTGAIESPAISFNIRLSSLVPLIDRGYNFSISYYDNKLVFTTEDGKVKFSPLYVETMDKASSKLIEKYIQFNDTMASHLEADRKIEHLEYEIADIERSHTNFNLMTWSSDMISSNPFSDPTDMSKSDEYYEGLIVKRKEELKKLEKARNAIQTIDMKEFSDIINIADSVHEVVDFCGDYAMLTLRSKNAFIFQKVKCPIMTVQGYLLLTLYRHSKGEGFLLWNDSLVFMSQGKDSTVVFMEKYLPNTEVDSRIITRDVVREKYTVNLQSVLSVASIVRNKFPNYSLDMGAGVLSLSNDNGELVEISIDVADAKTAQLQKLLKGEEITGDISMAVIDIPDEVRGLLSYFRGEVNITVKDNKVIFKQGTLFLVFSRRSRKR